MQRWLMVLAQAPSWKDVVGISAPQAVTLIALIFALAFAAPRLVQLRRLRNGGENGPERRSRSCLLLDQRAGEIEARTSALEAGQNTIREDLAGLRSVVDVNHSDLAALRQQVSDNHGDTMSALGSITERIHALAARMERR